MIQVQNLSKRYGDKLAVDNVSITVSPGEIFGYLGPNGAGKSTTIKMLTGLLKPDSGTMMINGFDLSKEPVQAKRQFGYVPESGALYEKLTPNEYLQMLARMYKMYAMDIDAKVNETLELFNMFEHRNEKMSSFSKGMKQRIVIAGAIIHNPPVLFLDEPLNGLDANTVLLVKELLHKFAEQGKTIFYTSHILDVVEKVCTRVAIIHQGKIVAEGKVKDLESITSQSSLELVFKQLTQGEDAQIAVEAFTRTMGTK